MDPKNLKNLIKELKIQKFLSIYTRHSLYKYYFLNTFFIKLQNFLASLHDSFLQHIKLLKIKLSK